MNARTHADPPAIDTGVAGEGAAIACRPESSDWRGSFVARTGTTSPSRHATSASCGYSIPWGVSFGALHGPQVALVREHVRAFVGAPRPTLIGAGQRSALRSTSRGVPLTLGRTGIESEANTEAVTTRSKNVVAAIARELGLEKVMFAAADPEVFGWYVNNYGPEVNLFVDHRQIVQLECLRRGIWGTKSLSGRVVAYSAG
jgi:hypothetical protein